MAYKRVLVTVAVAGLAAAASTGITWASIPDASGVIHACIAKGGLPVAQPAAGTVRIIDPANQTCLRNETPVSWSQAGPAGPPGPQGEPGQREPSDAFIAHNFADVQLSGTALTTVVALTLPAGMYVVSGKTSVANDGATPSFTGCQISATSETDLTIPPSTAQDAAIQELVVLDAVTLPAAGSIQLACQGNDGDASESEIVATQVGAIHS
jgi:hypothetical protein